VATMMRCRALAVHVPACEAPCTSCRMHDQRSLDPAVQTWLESQTTWMLDSRSLPTSRARGCR
jgi:hypothetical protein